MTARKIKHARALAKREEYMRTVKEGNLDVLRKAHSQREQEQKRAEQQAKDRKMDKSKRLANANKAKPATPKKES